MMIHCPCCSQKSYASCCEPFILEKQRPSNPEALMRSRYTAYSMANIDYIKKTMRGQALAGFQEKEASFWAKRVHWIKLHVLHVELGVENRGYVSFEAFFVDGSRLKSICEKSEFVYDGGLWYYVDGISIPKSHSDPVISRNTECPCGSKRKFKNCHGKSG